MMKHLALQKAEAFYFHKFLPSIVSFFTIQPLNCDIVLTLVTDNSHDHIPETLIVQKPAYRSNTTGNMTVKSCFAKPDIKPEPIFNPCSATLDGTSVAKAKPEYTDTTENTVSISDKQDKSTECQGTRKYCKKDLNRKGVKPNATTKVKSETDLQLITKTRGYFFSYNSVYSEI